MTKSRRLRSSGATPRRGGVDEPLEHRRLRGPPCTMLALRSQSGSRSRDLHCLGVEGGVGVAWDGLEPGKGIWIARARDGTAAGRADGGREGNNTRSVYATHSVATHASTHRARRSLPVGRVGSCFFQYGSVPPPRNMPLAKQCKKCGLFLSFVTPGCRLGFALSALGSHAKNANREPDCKPRTRCRERASPRANWALTASCVLCDKFRHTRAPASWQS